MCTVCRLMGIYTFFSMSFGESHCERRNNLTVEEFFGVPYLDFLLSENFQKISSLGFLRPVLYQRINT